jgi:flagellar biosynthesis anti-sigma factor FlgM
LLDMKVNDPNLSSLTGAASTASRAQEAARTAQTGQQGAAGGTTSSDDIHLSELVRSLRSLAADSPERQARIEQIARAYAGGNYNVDAQATASKIIGDALHHP